MKRTFLILLSSVLLLAGVWIGYKLATHKPVAPETQKETVKTESFKDTKSGVSLSLPVGYKTVKVAEGPKSLVNSKSSVVMQLQRSNPQAFVIVQHDSGLSGPAALLHQSPLEYVETTIRQFYPVRYGSTYKNESLNRTKIGSREAVEHIYSYTDKDGKPNKVRLLVIIWSDDETYNIILQSNAANFETIKGDLDSIKITFKVAE